MMGRIRTGRWSFRRECMGLLGENGVMNGR